MVLIVQARLTVKEGSAKVMEERLLAVAPEYKTHPGTLDWFVMRNPKNTNEFHITERYTDKAAIAYHASTDLYKETSKFFKTILVDNKVEIFQELSPSSKL